jgi:hypothetical protein
MDCKNDSVWKEFDLNNVRSNSSIIVIGKRQCGKSFLIRDIMYHLRNIPGGIVISRTGNEFYKNFFPDLYIHNNNDTINSTLQRIFVRQCVLSNEKDINSRGIIVMDDNIFSRKYNNTDHIHNIMMNGRNHKLSYILSTSSPYGIRPDWRLNFDYVFLFKENFPDTRRELWQKYASMFPTYAEFERAFDICTDNYGAMVIDQTSLSDNVFRFRAQERVFSFGSDEFNDVHTKYYNWNHNFSLHRNSLSHQSNDIFIDGTKYLFDYFVNVDKLNDEFKSYDKTPLSKKSDKCNEKHNTNVDEVPPMTYLNSNNDHCDEGTSLIINNDNNDSDSNSDIIDNNNVLQLAYVDETYRLMFKTNNLNNHKLIKMLCKHISSLKNNQLNN